MLNKKKPHIQPLLAVIAISLDWICKDLLGHSWRTSGSSEVVGLSLPSTPAKRWRMVGVVLQSCLESHRFFPILWSLPKLNMLLLFCFLTCPVICHTAPKFVAAYLIPDNDDRDNDKVYFFFTEKAAESDGKGRAIFSRVGRICVVSLWSYFCDEPCTGNWMYGSHLDCLRNYPGGLANKWKGHIL